MGAKVLVIEDDPDALKIISSTLTASGYQVLAGYGGEDGIRKAKKHHPDLVLTDLAMPSVSGVDVIRAIKSDPATATIRVVAVTAYMWDDIGRCAAEAGCDGYIQKPVRVQQLREEIEKYLKPVHA
jgi:CheY-like chemotaxis protein